MVTRSPNTTATGASRNSGDGDRYVETDDIRKAVAGHEPDVLKAIGIDWPGGSKHITCPYPDHGGSADWRWDDKEKKAFCSCAGRRGEPGFHSIFDVVMVKEGCDFAAAKIRVAEAIGRSDLIQVLGKYQAMDAASLLAAPVENRDDHLPVAYLAYRLGVSEAEVPRPRTRMVGIKALGYFDAPAGKDDKPKHVGNFPCAVFETEDVDGRRHAHRIYLAPGGAGKADLGKRADGEDRDPKKSAKVGKNDRITGRAVIWGDPVQAPHLIVAEGIETAAAVALVWRAEIQAGTVAVASAVDANGIEAFRPWPATRIITVAADRDEGVNEDGRPRDQRGERAARKLAMARQDRTEVRIALPGEPGTKTDWLDVLLTDGADAVRAGVAHAEPFVRTDAGGSNDRGGQKGQQQDDSASGSEAPPEQWPDPLPLVSPADEPAPYPTDALPQILREACEAYQAFGQQPMALVACSALAAASLATQGLADVERAPGLKGPISLNIIVVAQSGERKTSADKRMSEAVRMWELEKKAAMKSEVDAARADIAAFNAEKDGLLAKIKTQAGNSKSNKTEVADLDKLKHELKALEAQAPVEPVLPDLFYEDVTPEKLAEAMAGGWPSASLWSDEAGLVVGGHGMGDKSLLRFLTLFNRFWDGQPFSRKRSTTKSVTVEGRRLTACLMMQEPVLAQLLAAGDGASRGSGFMARFLMAWPVSTMGGRFYRAGNPNDPALVRYDARLRELLDTPLPVEGEGMVLKPHRLPLSNDARETWIEFHDKVERALQRHAEFGDVADFAAKTADNAARIAGVFHVLEHGPVGEIAVETMEDAAELALWHLHDAKRIIGAIDVPEAIADAKVLLGWLLAQDGAVTPRDISYRGPNPLRDRERRDRAIETLIETNHVVRLKVGRKGEILEINPKLRRQP